MKFHIFVLGNLAKTDLQNVWMTLDQACGMYSRMARQ